MLPLQWFLWVLLNEEPESSPDWGQLFSSRLQEGCGVGAQSGEVLRWGSISLKPSLAKPHPW